MGWQDAPLAEAKQSWSSAPLVDAPSVSDFSGNLRVGPLDTGIALPQAVNKRLAQFGSGMADWITGAKQIAGIDTKEDAGDKRKLDAQLNDDLLGKGLNVAGQVAPSFALPFGYLGAAGRAGPIIEGGIAGATQGTLQPVAPGETRAANMAIGTLGGAAVPAAVQGFRSLATPRDGALAQRAIQQYGIPLGVADVSDSRMVKAARSILNDLPITGAMGAADREGVQQGFNRAIGRAFGEDAASLTPDVMQGARTRIGGELDRLWSGNSLTVDGQFIQGLQNLQQRAQNLNPEQAQAVNRQVQNLLQRVDANGQIPGSFANNFQSELRLIADGEKGLHKQVLNDLRQNVIGTFNRSVGGADAEALTTARGQYRAMKTIEPLMNKGDAGVAGRISGDVPAALLPGQVAQQYGNRVAQSPFADLGQIAGRYLVDRTPQTGGSVRAAMQNGTVGAMAGAGGLGLAAQFGALPVAAGGMGLAAGLQGILGSTRAAQSILQPDMQRALLAHPELGPALRELLSTSLQRAPIPMGLGLLTAPALE